MDEIRITGLEVFAHHGVYESEAVNGQKFIINATLFCDTQAAANTDCLEDTIDYGAVSLHINEYMTKNRYNLIETVANNMARSILKKFTDIRKIKLEICKPEAPIPLPFKDVSVTVERSWHKAYIAGGSNMGDSEGYIEDAMENLDADECINIISKSDFVKSKAYGGVEQEDFTNNVFVIETLYNPYELLEKLHYEEKKAGRERLVHWGPRTLDLDILYYDDLVMDEKTLTIPHREISKRDFVLLPLSEAAPYKTHPVNGMTAKEMLNELTDNYVI